VSTYREIIGKKIKKVSSDPSSGADGEMWYNSTTGTLRGPAILEAWSSGSPLVTENYGAGGAGTQTAFLYWGGDKYPAPARTNETYEYNGSGWAAGGDYIGSVSYVGGCGTQTAALGAGGFTGTATPTASAEYNGTSWTAGNSMSQQRMNTGASFIGIQTAAMVVGGDQYPSTPRSLTTCEEYDGTNWGSGGAYPVVIQNTGQGGPQTAGWAAGGLSDPAPGTPNTVRDTFNLYDGTNWTASTTLPGAMMRMGSAGTQTATLYFGGTAAGPTPVATTFGYDGSSWSAKPSLATARQSIAGGGVSSTSTAAIGAGGYAPSKTTAATEEWNSSTNAVTAAAWAAGGALNTGRMNISMGGTQTASILVGGHISPGGTPSGVELYDGSSWTTSGTVPYTADYGVYAGTSTSGIQIGGAPYTTTSAELSGTSWTAGGSLNTGRSQLMGAGTQTAGLAFGGYTDATTETAVTEEYNGTAFSNSPNSMSLARGRGAGFGIQTAALCVAGNATPSETISAATEEYNGTSWTAGGNYVVATGSFIGGFGTQTDGTAVGGGTPSYVATAAGYDGTAWSTRPSAAYAAGRTQTAGANGSAGLRAGGGPNTSQRDGSEEFTGATSALNIKTFTTS